ncbi:sugar ABC transporter substrate-binding protein [Paenibacillus radicis (ex Xue et al. 2023)]|uniref:Sugar ABC transporter substrate-binding protein n=1 Tax=Paenibacillus radicis (ex Xue et al. 2023) TaxID=2972489 RepID=A0ABT1YPB9_9BACL|nr:sugar ABC transporter substrate-binding protein [Paenibacillus radicis (ex Xue et al. 2023)]MCR8633840.1 sugar ABC transporter substrate-binding protein [Paenibacillus radicis (ex Xue et al. 2023)]
MKKPVFKMTCFLSLLLTVSACSSANQANVAPKPNTPIELTFVTLNGRDNDGYNEVINHFEKANPDIKVRLEMYPYRQLLETVEVKMGSKSKDIDILSVDAPLVANYTVKGYLEPLEPLFKDVNFKDKWIKSSLDAGTYNGALMAAPINTSSQVLYYNKDILNERGIVPPSPDIDKRWTWEQLVDSAKKLTFNKNGGNQPDVFGFSFEQIDRPYQLLALPQSLGAQVISANGITATGYTNSSQMSEAGKFYFDLFNTWKVSPKISSDLSVEFFMTGKVAMFIGGPYNAEKFKNANLNFGIAPHPYFQGKKVATPTGSWHAGISKYSAKKEAAAKFIQYLTFGEGAKIWNDKHHDVPAYLDILNEIEKDPKYNAFPNQVMRIAAYEARNTGVPRPSTPGYLEWESILGKSFEDMKNGAEPKSTLDTASKQIDGLLKKYESLVK